MTVPISEPQYPQTSLSLIHLHISHALRDKDGVKCSVIKYTSNELEKLLKDSFIEQALLQPIAGISNWRDAGRIRPA